MFGNIQEICNPREFFAGITATTLEIVEGAAEE